MENLAIAHGTTLVLNLDHLKRDRGRIEGGPGNPTHGRLDPRPPAGDKTRATEDFADPNRAPTSQPRLANEVCRCRRRQKTMHLPTPVGNDYFDGRETLRYCFPISMERVLIRGQLLSNRYQPTCGRSAGRDRHPERACSIANFSAARSVSVSVTVVDQEHNRRRALVAHQSSRRLYQLYRAVGRPAA